MESYQEFSAIVGVYQVKQRNEITTPTNTTGTSLGHLNEYCLLEIFSSPLLGALDLCSLSKTCSRFNQIIQRLFLKEFYVKVDRNGYRFTSEKFPNLYIQTKDADRILKNFGSDLFSITLHRFDAALVKLVAKYFDCITFKRLVIHNQFRFYVDLLLNNWASRWPIDQLVELDIDVDYHSWFEFETSKPTFTNLEQFTFRGLQSESIEEGVKASNFLLDFCVRHEGLRTVKLYATRLYCQKKFISIIVKICINLEVLLLRGFYFSDECDRLIFSSMPQLKMFELREADFAEIVKSVEQQQRKNVLTLNCYFNFNYVNDCDTNRKIRLVKSS